MGTLEESIIRKMSIPPRKDLPCVSLAWKPVVVLRRPSLVSFVEVVRWHPHPIHSNPNPDLSQTHHPHHYPLRLVSGIPSEAPSHFWIVFDHPFLPQQPTSNPLGRVILASPLSHKNICCVDFLRTHSGPHSQPTLYHHNAFLFNNFGAFTLEKIFWVTFWLMWLGLKQNACIFQNCKKTRNEAR